MEVASCRGCCACADCCCCCCCWTLRIKRPWCKNGKEREAKQKKSEEKVKEKGKVLNHRRRENKEKNRSWHKKGRHETSSVGNLGILCIRQKVSHSLFATQSLLHNTILHNRLWSWTFCKEAFCEQTGMAEFKNRLHSPTFFFCLLFASLFHFPFLSCLKNQWHL
jgi:hypothetical protein